MVKVHGDRDEPLENHSNEMDFEGPDYEEHEDIDRMPLEWNQKKVGHLV